MQIAILYLNVTSALKIDVTVWYTRNKSRPFKKQKKAERICLFIQVADVSVVTETNAVGRSCLADPYSCVYSCAELISSSEIESDS